MDLSNFIRVPITINELVQIKQSDLDYLTVYRTDNGEELTKSSVLYLDDEYIEIDDESDEEIFPQFILDNNLEYYFNGDIASDIILNTQHQVKSPTIKDYLINFNYYDKRDCFYTFK